MSSNDENEKPSTEATDPNINEESLEAGQSAEPTEEKPSVEELLKQAEQKYMYLYADFENFKKRAQKEKSDIRQFGWEGVALELLGVLDNLGLAIQHSSDSKEKALIDGIKMVQKLFEDVLSRNGVTQIKALGQNFDPNLHEATGNVESDAPEGQIIEVQLHGYEMHGRLLRPARVVVSSGKQKEKSK